MRPGSVRSAVGWILTALLLLLTGLWWQRSVPRMRRALRFGTDGWNATSDQDEPRWEEDPYGVASEEPARNDAPSPALSYRLLSVPEPRADRAQRGDLDRAVVSRAVLRLAVTDVSAAAAHAQEVASVHGGYTIEARIERRADATSARVVIAVPATAFRGVLDELRRLSGLRAIESESVSGQDVTSELTDIEARLRASRATEERFLTLLQRAESVQDIVRIEQELNRIRYEIERLEAMQRRVEEQVRYASVTLFLRGHELSSRRRLVQAVREGWLEGIGTLRGVARVTGRMAAMTVAYGPIVAALVWVARRLALPVVGDSGLRWSRSVRPFADASAGSG